LIWVSTTGGVLGLLFLFLDRYEAVSITPQLVGALILFSVLVAVALADHERRARRKEERKRAEENKTVLRDEIRWNLQRLASQIAYVETVNRRCPPYHGVRASRRSDSRIAPEMSLLARWNTSRPCHVPAIFVHRIHLRRAASQRGDLRGGGSRSRGKSLRSAFGSKGPFSVLCGTVTGPLGEHPER
jgi:hypothetical protein